MLLSLLLLVIDSAATRQNACFNVIILGYLDEMVPDYKRNQTLTVITITLVIVF